MTVRVTVEGGRSFELGEMTVAFLRRVKAGDSDPADDQNGILYSLAAALPPEPYQPKEGDRVHYRRPEWAPNTKSTGVYEYLGQWRDWHVLSGGSTNNLPWLVSPDTEFRRAES